MPAAKTNERRKRAKKEEEEEEEEESASKAPSKSTSRSKPSKVSKSKQKDASRVEDYPDRIAIDWKVGAHVSAAGGVENAILNAASIGANAFALFLKSQRKWTSPNLTERSIEAFKTRLLQFNYAPDLVLPHGSYLINLGNPDEGKREKSYECFLDDLKRCEQLGLTRYNFHPGSTVGSATKSESLDLLASCLNRAHKETSTVMTVIENMAGSGNILGSKFDEIAHVIGKIEDKSRVGVCLDTCHTFAAGYDIRSKDAFDATLEEFDRKVGLQYLRGMHLNDSKTPLASNKDRHENIGRGHISLATFGYLMRDPRLRNIPLILETPTNDDTDVWKKEIEVLNELNLRPPEDEDALKRLADEVGKAASKGVKQDKGKKKKRDGSPKESNARKKRKGEDSNESNDEEDT